MGWSSGSTLMDEVIMVIADEVTDPLVKKAIFKGLIEAFENADWDNYNECEGQDDAYDAAVAELHPNE